MIQCSQFLEITCPSMLPIFTATDLAHFQKNAYGWVREKCGGEDNIPSSWKRIHQGRGLGKKPRLWHSLDLQGWMCDLIQQDPSVVRQKGFKGMHLGHLAMHLSQWIIPMSEEEEQTPSSFMPLIKAGVDFSTPNDLGVYPMHLFILNLQEALVRRRENQSYTQTLMEIAPTLLGELMQAISKEEAKNPLLPNGMGCIDQFLDEISSSSLEEQEDIQALRIHLEKTMMSSRLQAATVSKNTKRL